MEQITDDELPSFDIGLSDSTHDGANLRFENDLNNPYERSNIIERRGLIHVRCEMREIVHGRWSPDGDEEATLLVILFRFDPDDAKCRVKLARIKLVFSGASNTDPDPEVVRIWPDETYALLPTTRTETVCVGATGSIGITSCGEVGAEFSREKTTERKLQSMGNVRSSADTEGRNYGLHNSVSWTLMENSDTKSGVPVSMQCAILLKRRAPEEKFAATVNITARADRQTAIKEWVQSALSQPKRVDPILFDPKRPPTNQLRVYDMEIRRALGNVELNDRTLTDITLRRVWGGAEKHI